MKLKRPGGRPYSAVPVVLKGRKFSPPEQLRGPVSPLPEPPDPLSDPPEPFSDPPEPFSEPPEPLLDPPDPSLEPPDPLSDPPEPLLDPPAPGPLLAPPSEVGGGSRGERPASPSLQARKKRSELGMSQEREENR